MKIHPALRALYESQRELNEELQGRVERLIDSVKEPRWHYESRIKGEESFALKVEAGLTADATRMDDFLASVLVVPNLVDLAKAEDMMCQVFAEVDRRPSGGKDAVAPDTFPFDDLRLYFRLKEDDTLPPSPSDRVIFELQIKTFLQHAWSVATHDVVYKSDSTSWRRERLAHQVKAMLEHAEYTMRNMRAFEAGDGLPVSAPRYDDLNKIIATVRRHWGKAELPVDLKRLAVATLSLLERVNVGVDKLDDLLLQGRVRYGGKHNIDWSPYRSVLEYLVDTYPNEMRRAIGRKQRSRVVMYAETVERLRDPKGSVQGAYIIQSEISAS